MDHLYSSYIKRLAPDTLKKWIKDQKENVIIVDVRDSDYKYVSIHASDNLSTLRYNLFDH